MTWSCLGDVRDELAREELEERKRGEDGGISVGDVLAWSSSRLGQNGRE